MLIFICKYNLYISSTTNNQYINDICPYHTSWSPILVLLRTFKFTLLWSHLVQQYFSSCHLNKGSLRFDDATAKTVRDGLTMYKNWLIHSMLFSFWPFVTCSSQSYHNWQWKYSLLENKILFNWNARLSSYAKKSWLTPYHSLIYHIYYQGKVVSIFDD